MTDPNMEERPRRMRIIFEKGREIKYISHLDLVRAWERSLRRAGVDLAYSQGFNPRPRMQVASALPVGHTGLAEVVDVYLETHTTPDEFEARLLPVLPAGLRVVEIYEVEYSAPSLQSELRSSEYRVYVETDLPPEEIQRRVDAFLSAEEVAGEKKKKGKTKRFNLRPLVEEVQVLETAPRFLLSMRLQNGPRGSARPEMVLGALDLEDAPVEPERVGLCFADESGRG